MLKTKLLYIFLVVLLFSGCSDFNRIQKTTDLEKKLEAAIKYYEKNDFYKAQVLFDELISVYRGTDKDEKVSYYHAFTTYEMEDYITASYYFKNFVKRFPTSAKAEECAFHNAYCYFLSSPNYSLDQTDTKTAIREMQAFIDHYPKSEKIKQCNEIIDQLRGKLELKDYETAKQYYYIGDYKAAIVAFNNTIKDFADSPHREELYFLVIKAQYLLAVNSIEVKKLERVNASIESYLKYVDMYPSGQYLKDAENIYDSALKLKNKLSKTPNDGLQKNNS